MLFKSKFTLLFLAVSAIPASAFAESSNNQVAADEYRAVAVGVLPTVEVRGKRADKPFKTPSAVSHRDADELGQDANTLIRTMPGTFTQHDLGQGGFAVNIRGLEGFGRVNTTVDGVTQTFFQANPAHGWNGNTTYVDENFIAGIDVSRGSVAGVGGVNALAGNAELRTLDVDDLVAKDRKFGFQTTYRQGTNGYGKNGMMGAAVRHEFENGGSIGFLSAISGKRKSGYKNGAGEVITGDEFDADTAAESGIRSWGTLNKLHIRPSRYHSIILGHMMNRARFTNNHSPLQVNTQTGLLKYRYNPLSDWVDLQLDASFSNARQKFLQGESAREDYVGRTTRSPTTSLTLQNRSTTDIGNSELSLNYGAKFMRTRYNSNYENNTMLLAEGKQNLDSAFFDAEWKPGKWTVHTGLGYERYGLRGYLPPTDDDGAIILPRGGDIRFNRKEDHLNPRFGVAYKPWDWLQVYANIGKSSRSPTVQEFMYVNNVQGSPYSVNPYLKGESSFNRDIGFNIHKQGIWKADDTLNLKVGYFNNRVKNYIVQDQFYICRDNGVQRCTIDEAVGSDSNAIGVFRNMPDTTKMRGWEIEGGYDFGRGYINLAWSKTRTTFPHDFLADLGFSHIRTMPSSVWMVDAGTRWLDNRLTVGTRISYTGKDTVAEGVDVDTQVQTTRQVAGNPKIIDLYATWQARKNLRFFFNIDNLTNRVYNYPLSGGTLATGNLGEGNNVNQGTGRGRTIYGGLTLKF